MHTKAGVHTRGDLKQMASGNWRVQVRRKTRYVAETFRRRKDGEEWALEMERNIDRNGSSKPRAARNVRTFGDLIDLHDDDMHEVDRRLTADCIASISAGTAFCADETQAKRSRSS